MKKLLCTLAVSLVGGGLMVTTPSAPAVGAGSMNVKVASFNVQSVSLDSTDGNKRPWRDRRGTVINQILSEDLDVIGLQELNHSKAFASRLVDGDTQMTDLRNGLNKAGGTYALTNPYATNCENGTTSYRCVYKYRAASGDNRIIYNTSTLRMVRQGTYTFKNQGTSFKSYLPWATFVTRATGQRFTFASTHLATGAEAVRHRQWNELIAKMKSLRSTYNLPVMVVGDFNTQKFSSLAADMLPAMKNNGFGDVTGQQAYQSTIAHPRAERRVNGFINSWNRLDRNIKNYSYYNDRTRMGNTIDYVFASNGLTVPEYKLVIDYDSDLQVNGTFPSDHNMVKATVSLG